MARNKRKPKIPLGLDAVEQFSEEVGKQFAVREWGEMSFSGDDPSYIQNMAQCFANSPNLAYEDYFDADVGNAQTFSQTPNAYTECLHRIRATVQRQF